MDRTASLSGIMRITAAFLVLLATFWSALGRAADAGGTAVTVSLDTAAAPAAAANPPDARLARVSAWITERAPACPPDAVVAAAQQFLEELQGRHPEQLDRLLGADFSIREVEPALLRQVAAQLKGPQWAGLREQLARRRIEAMLAASGESPAEADMLVAKIKETADYQYRRLVEGRIEDDDLASLLKGTRQGNAASPALVPEKPKALTAAEVMSEFARHNQVGSAADRLRAYMIEGRLRTAAGEDQRLLLFKMRPDRFRLVVQAGGSTRLILAGAGGRFWQQVPGHAAQAVNREAMGVRRYLGEYVDPLFGADGYTYEKVADGSPGNERIHRIAVRRPDGSGYVALVDRETFHEVGREEPDGSSERYSDFRNVGGVTFAFREEQVDREGRRGVLELTRVTPNPGLVGAFFEPPISDDQAYFVFERLAASGGPAPQPGAR